MINDKNVKISKTIKKLKHEIREFKKNGIPLGKIFDYIGNNCYIYRALEEGGVTSFETVEEGNNILKTVKEEVAKEIVKKESDQLPKCDYFRLGE